MKSPAGSLPAFRFISPKQDGKIQILNQHSYVMGHYDQRRGTVTWERVLLATQKAEVEKYLLTHYPVSKN